MSLEISPQVAQMVHGIFATGKFASESDVLATAVQLLHDRQQLVQKIEQGCRELDNGQRLSADKVFEQLQARAKELDGIGK